VLAAAALLALPGCGSDDEPSATTAPEDGGGVVVAALGDSISAGNPAYDPDPGRRAALGFGNRRIEAIGRDLGVDVIGFHDALEDPGRPGVMAPRLTADGDHPSIAGYRLLGARVADALER